MNDYEWWLSVKYSPDQPRVPAGQSEGGRWTSGNVPSHSDRGRAWIDNLTEAEQSALFRWGQSGYAIRKLQSGHPEKIESDLDRRFAEHDLPHWESALAKGVPYEGTIYRGLTSIPESVIDDWRKTGIITLNNDQSATKNEEYGKTYTTGWRTSKRVAHALWKVEQKSGIDLFEETNVTYGLKPRDEYEIVMRKGTTYRIKNMTYYRKTGEVWPTAGFFEGTEWSLENPPPDWRPHHDFNGYYLIELEEV